MKKYNLIQSWAFMGDNRRCPECNSTNIKNKGTINDGWTYVYKCKDCKAKYHQEAAATGQDPWLTKIN